MPRLMSVSLTEDAVVERRKTVTRRLGWVNLKPRDRLTLCRKVMGRKPGEPLVRLTDVEVVSVRREPLDRISVEDVTREGFPEMTVDGFVRFFCDTHKGCKRDTVVTRIEWRYLDRPRMQGWPGMLARTFVCNGCRGRYRQRIHLTVHSDGPNDGRVGDRQRLLAAANEWVIDLRGHAWCPEHKDGAAKR